jgi:hypothetical protein
MIKFIVNSSVTYNKNRCSFSIESFIRQIMRPPVTWHSGFVQVAARHWHTMYTTSFHVSNFTSLTQLFTGIYWLFTCPAIHLNHPESRKRRRSPGLPVSHRKSCRLGQSFCLSVQTSSSTFRILGRSHIGRLQSCTFPSP